MFVSRKLTLAVQLALVVGAGVATPAVFAQDAMPPPPATPAAQDQPEQLKGVVVTGSHIRQMDLETQQPVFTMNREEIERTGLATVGDILSEMTIGGNPTYGKQSVTSGTTEQGGSYVNLRGLGSGRTLVLVNGKRWSTSSRGMTDVSTIPSAIIQRIEVLKDGASAVYGSDAVSGVVNIITRKDFEGAEANAYFGQNQGGDGTTQQYDFTVGSVSEDASISMSVSYTKQEAMWDRDRLLTRYSDGPRHPYSGNSITTPLGKFTDKSGDTWVLNNLGDDATDFSNYHLYTGDASDKYNTRQQMMFRIPTEQKSMYVQGRYNFTNNLSFRSTAMYSERKASKQLAGYPLRSSSFRAMDGLISSNSIYNPVNQDIEFRRRTTEVPRVTDNVSRVAHLDATLEGWFGVGEYDWNWDVGVNFNKGSGTKTGTGSMNLVNAQRAIGPSFIDAGGVARCGIAGNVIEGCIPWNVLGGPGAMTPELRDYLYVIQQTSYGSKNVSYTANITGGLFNVPTGGTVAFAAGVERREVSGYTTPDQFSQSGLSTSLSSGPTRGEYAVNEAYAELSIPVLRDLPGAQDLTFDLAGRYSKYTSFGSTYNGKYGFKWKPIDDLMIRGNYAQAFRAPTIRNLYGGTSETFDGYTDPCDAKFGANVYGQAVHAACVAQLQQAGFANAGNFRQTNSLGYPVVNAGATTQYPFTSGANANLEPETAITRTLGAVYSPSQVQGLTLTLDWYEIKLDNVITGVSADRVLKNCYMGDTSFCNRFDRNASGQVINLNHSTANMGTLDIEGYDFEVRYRLPETIYGKFTLRSTSSYLVKWNERTSADVPVSTRNSWYSNWRLRNNTSLDWQKGDFGATWTIRYFSSLMEGCEFGANVECNMPNHVSPETGLSPTRRVGAVAFNDFRVRWNAPWNARVALGVKNVFDRKPPLTYSAGSGSPPINPAYDIGRYWFASYHQSF